MFATIKEVKNYASEWLWTYNNDRPNGGRGGITPAQELKLAARVLLSSSLKMGGLPILARIIWRSAIDSFS
jgi:hypothetical protein